MDWLTWLEHMPALVKADLHLDAQNEALRHENLTDALYQRRHRAVIQAAHGSLLDIRLNLEHRYTWGPSLRLDFPALKMFRCSCLLSREKAGCIVEENVLYKIFTGVPRYANFS